LDYLLPENVVVPSVLAIYVHGTTGVDNVTCGSFEEPCNSVSYAVNQASSSVVVKVLYDVYSFTYSFPTKTFEVTGVSQIVNTEELYPIIKCNYTYERIFYWRNNSRATFSNFIVEVDCSKSVENKYILFQVSSITGDYLRLRFFFFFFNFCMVYVIVNISMTCYENLFFLFVFVDLLILQVLEMDP
jgi:hypothetical protein